MNTFPRQIPCPVCGTNNELNPDEIKPCRSCGFPVGDEFNNASFLPSVRHDMLVWSRRRWNELKEKDKKIECLEKELAQLKGNLASMTQEAQPDDLEIDKSKEEVNTENIDDLWRQLKPHCTSYINQEIQDKQNDLAEKFKNRLDEMRAEIEKDIEARFKEQNQIELPDQTQSDHDSSWPETSSDTSSLPRQDSTDVNREITSSRATSSSIDSQPDDWSWLNDSKPDDRTVVSPDNIEEMRAKDAPILLTEQTPGNYWIVKDPYRSFLYLVPDPKIRIFNSHNIECTKKIFDCQNYDDLKRQTFEVKQPAIVKQLEAEKKWEIQKKGKLVFVSKN